MSECYGMLQNASVTALTIFELLREKQHWGGWDYSPIPRLGLTFFAKTRNFQSMSVEKDL